MAKAEPHIRIATRVVGNGVFRELSSDAIKVWCVLEWHAGRKRVCWPSWLTLQEETGLSLRKLSRALKELKVRRFVATTNQGKQGGGHYNIYSLIEGVRTK